MSENRRTLTFTFLICFVTALLLSLVATLLKEPQENAKQLDRNKQLLLASQLLGYDGRFQVRDQQGLYIPARALGTELIADRLAPPATPAQIFAIYNDRVRPMLVSPSGDLLTFQEANIDWETYLTTYEKKGFSKAPLPLLYLIRDIGYVIPVNGFGLWDAIYGYLALSLDGNQVLGATWYQQAETAGLGANIALPEWQLQFRDKRIFQPSLDGSTDFAKAPLGITVVKGKVSEVIGSSPKKWVSVDGISGASLTGNGVTNAYFDSLAPYRPFLVRLHG